jgi:hypothetical protein
MTMDAPAKTGPNEQKAPSTAEAASPKPEARVPRLRDYVALVPLLLLSVALSLWLGLHARKFLAWFGGSVGLGVLFPIVWKALPKQTTDTAWASFSGLFRSRTLATALWVACAAFLAVTLLVSSIQMTTTDVSAPLTMYRYTVADAAEPAPVAPPAVDSLRLGKLNPSGGFFVPWPFGRRAWVGTSAQRQSREVRIYPWIPVRLTYPDDFGAPAMLAVLPTGSLLEEIGKAEPPRLIVRSDSGAGSVIAEDTLRTHKAIVFSFAASQPVDSIARRTWLDAAQSRLHADSVGAAQFVDELFPIRPRRTSRPIASGERVRVVLIAHPGDTLASDTVTLQSSLSHVFLRRRP